MSPSEVSSTGPSEPVLSIIIVNYNTGDLLSACLDSLFADDTSRWEVIVVDNGSTDDSLAVVETRFPQVILIASPENLGFSGGNNLALRQARGEFFLLLNTDTLVPPGSLGRMIDHMVANVWTGALGPRLVNTAGQLELSCGREPNLTSEIVHKLLLHKAFPFFRFGGWHHRDRRLVGWVTGACLMVRRQAAEQTGYLDQGFFMCYEDVDWCMRIARAGWQIIYFPYSEVVHYRGGTIGRNLGELLVISQQSLFYLFQKHFGAVRLALLRCFTVIEMGLRSSVWMAAFIVSRHRRPEASQRLSAYRQIFVRTIRERSYWDPTRSPDST